MGEGGGGGQTGGGLLLLHKNKLKFDTFNDKKKFKQKCFSLS